MRKLKKTAFVYILIAVAVLTISCLGSQTVTVMAENKPIERNHCIIIDAGHGGEDGGAVSCTGKPESVYNLEISVRLNDLFHFLGYDTKMIRTSDISIYTDGDTLAQKKISDLKERVRIVNSTENALLISIHQNNFSEQQYNGAQVFYAEGSGSRKLAEQLQLAFKSTLNPTSRRMSKPCTGVYLMEHINRAGVLIECGFLSNRVEEAKLNSAEYQKKVCCVIVPTVTVFLSNT